MLRLSFLHSFLRSAVPTRRLRLGKAPAVSVVYELLAVVVPVVLLVQLLAMLGLELRASTIADEQSYERLSRMADTRARSLGEPVWRLEFDKVGESLSELALDPRVVFATVTNDTGAAVAHIVGDGNAVAIRHIVREFTYQKSHTPELVGRLTIGVSETSVMAGLTNLYASGLFVTVWAGLVLCVSMRLAAETLIGRPLGMIIDAIHRARMDGEPRKVLLDSSNEFGALGSALNELQDAQARAKSQLQFQTTHDDVTGLPNRRLLQPRLAQMAEGPVRYVALHVVGLDGLKGINETFGHDAGDRYLAHAAARLRACLTRNEWVGRLVGDEFVVLQDETKSEDDAKSFADALITTIAAPVEINGKHFNPRASVGLAVRRTDHPEFASLLSLADIALKHAKENCAGGVGVLSPELMRQYRRRSELVMALPTAFQDEQFETWFQGQFDINSGQIVGLEALIRWRHPKYGMISPGEFVPLIEQSGYSTTLARLVFERLCQARIVITHEGLDDLPIAMNVSPHELTDFGFVTEIVEIAARYGVPLTGFELEITEGLLINNVAHTLEAIERIRDAGVRVALDDFGQGYSSLAYLRRFPLDRLKIDKAFTREVPENLGDLAVLEIIVALAAKLNLELVVEGVEREAQAEALRRLGVSVGQGFLYHRPQPLDELVDFIRQNQAGRGDAELRIAV